MKKISPKLIDVERNRIETDDKLCRKSTEVLYDYLYYSFRPEYIETSRFPTQLFTNIKKELFKYVKNIT